MPQVDQILLHNETISFRTKKHFIIFFGPIAWTLLFCFFLFERNRFVIYGLPGLPLFNNMLYLYWVPAIAAAYSWINESLNYLTADFIVTNLRVIMREGFFLKHASETRLSAIAEINVTQNLLGQILNFGNISIHSFGGGADIFALIASPYQFQKKVSEQMNMPVK